MEEQDREIAERVLKQLQSQRDLPIGELVIRAGTLLLESPYVAHTLEKEDSEFLVINLREFDCTTFAENCLALARTARMKIPSFEQFTCQLELIRYRDGIRNGYPSRLHYFSDWISNNAAKELILDVSQEIAHTLVPNRVHFMSTHPGSYSALVANPALVDSICRQETEISQRMTWFIPENKIADYEDQLMNGDIAGIRTSIEGLDISHVVILWKLDGRCHFLHASSLENKVVVSDQTLDEYLENSRSATGIMVARPL